MERENKTKKFAHTRKKETMNLDLIATALSLYGLAEVPGPGDNPFILQMAKDCGFDDYIHDEIAWCSLFPNWVALKTGYERSKSLSARSWLDYGSPVEVPEIGDLVISWRINPTSPYGHVGFFINSRSSVLYLLGGNQNDSISIESFPSKRIIGCRRLTKLTL